VAGQRQAGEPDDNGAIAGDLSVRRYFSNFY
jgi:hypothetical protein